MSTTTAAEDLNYDFNYNMFIAKIAISNLPAKEDQEKVIRWLNRLSQCNHNIAEMKLRNDFMYYLVLNVQNGALQAPFTDSPTPVPLAELVSQLPGGGQGTESEAAPTEGPQKPLLLDSSPDGGAFLLNQPIPRCGAFCYLAVVAKKPSE